MEMFYLTTTTFYLSDVEVSGLGAGGVKGEIETKTTTQKQKQYRSLVISTNPVGS